MSTQPERPPPQEEPWQRIGEMVLTNLENRMERIRGMVTTFYRQFKDLSNDERVDKSKIINAELRGLIGSFRGLAKYRDEVDEFNYHIQYAWKSFKSRGGFTAYTNYVQEILEICVAQLDWWKFLFQMNPTAADDVIDHIFSKSIDSIRTTIIRTLLREGKITSKRDIQFLGLFYSVPEGVMKVEEARKEDAD